MIWIDVDRTITKVIDLFFRDAPGTHTHTHTRGAVMKKDILYYSQLFSVMVFVC